jgi:hypothetical protein
VLIELAEHHVDMIGYILIAALAVFLPLAYFAGADSRIDEVARRRGYHG